MSRCRSCGAQIVWAHHRHARGSPAPIDAEPVEGGNIVIGSDADGTTVYEIVPKVARKGPLHTNHFATCPDAARWRPPEEAA